MLFVPKAVTPEIRALCQKILNGAGSPAFVRVQPEDDARPGDCFMNVQHKLKRAGGAIVYSWQIWERPHQFIEAEFHAVWGSPEGHLLDITPKHIPTRYILFLKDPHRTFEGKENPERPSSVVRLQFIPSAKDSNGHKRLPQSNKSDDTLDIEPSLCKNDTHKGLPRLAAQR